MLDPFVKRLKDGDIVAFPTETVYGLGADAWNPTAVKKVFEQKGRPADNPLIVHVSATDMVEDFALEISDDARKLMERFWPGPLTLIFKKKPEVLDIITAGLDTVAIRWPNHPLSQELIAQTGPLVAPSANSSGRPSPTKADHVKEDFGEDFPVMEAGETDIGLESTVLDISQKPYKIYRPGAISAAEIEEVVGSEVKIAQPDKDTATKSPGTKYSHYSPDAKVQWLNVQKPSVEPESSLFLYHNTYAKTNRELPHAIYYQNDYKRMAHELYDRFREADHLGLLHVLIEPFTPEQKQQPIVQALINRISKAVG